MGSLQERRSASKSHGSSQQQQHKVPLKRIPRHSKEKRKHIFYLLSYGVPVFGFVAILVVLYLFNRPLSTDTPSHITPFPDAKVSDLSQFKGGYQEDLFWGTYRSQLYLGIRSRIPKSVLAGLMWIGVDENGVAGIRHTCEESDNFGRYGWLRHDGKSYGYQEILDGSILLKTTFVKKRFPSSGYGGDWAVRVSVAEIRSGDSSARMVPLLFYMADEAGTSLNIGSSDMSKNEHMSLVRGSKKEVGYWSLYTPGLTEQDVHFVGYSTPHMHNLTELVLQTLQMQIKRTGNMVLPDTAHEGSNVGVFQINARLPFEIDFVYVSSTSNNFSDIQERVENLSGSKLSKEIDEHATSFEKKFQETFRLQDKGFDDKYIEVGKTAISNLLGGIGYSFGQSRIAIPLDFQESAKNLDYWLYWPSSLYSAVPSRSKFPRGFLWDEGFHQLLIRRWDKLMSMEIISNWLDLMNVNGWIPREQILGAEARSKVPEEFVLQHTNNANPPALFLVLQDFLSSLSKEQGNISASDEYKFLERSYSRLQAWFNWFNTTQAGKVSGSYYWHGRDAKTNKKLNPLTLTSGLDDYPRASHPSSDERHLDLRCWMALAAKTMDSISSLIGQHSNKYQITAKQLTDLDLLNKLHYDTKTGRYYDYGNHTEKVKLEWKVLYDPDKGHWIRELIRVTNGQPRLRFVPQFGYVSLFPFIMKIIPADSPILEKQLTLIEDEKLLWTSYGLRSLGTTSSLYMKYNTEHDAPYWRGPVWINLNYLILRSLHHYSKEPGPYKDQALQIYKQLRDNLIRNIANSYYESGYLWEQYDNAADGKGKGAHPFTGWTSLVLLIMAEVY